MYIVYLKKATRDYQRVFQSADKQEAIDKAIEYHNAIKLFGDYVLPFTCVRIFKDNNYLIWQAGSI
jgi:hypothetical protein